jgi:stress response protein YsnF
MGKVGQVYFDDQSDRPEWVTVHTGLFGTNETFVPVQGAEFSRGRVTLGYDKQKIKNGPNMAEDGHRSEDQEQELYRYYGLDYGTTGTTGVSGGRDRDRDRDGDGDGDGDGVYDDVANTAVGRDTSGPTTDSAMTCSEEQLRVGTETRQTGKARLRKYVTTEHQQTTVPVSHEEVTLDREPITDANRGDA